MCIDIGVAECIYYDGLPVARHPIDHVLYNAGPTAVYWIFLSLFCGLYLFNVLLLVIHLAL